MPVVLSALSLSSSLPLFLELSSLLASEAFERASNDENVLPVHGVLAKLISKAKPRCPSASLHCLCSMAEDDASPDWKMYLGYMHLGPMILQSRP
eukprot:6174245-Pleurochrysis_carterae.AAC.1